MKRFGRGVIENRRMTLLRAAGLMVVIVALGFELAQATRSTANAATIGPEFKYEPISIKLLGPTPRRITSMDFLWLTWSRMG